MRRFFLLICCVCSLHLSAQYANIDRANQQEAFMQLNQSFYLSGERVWFGLFLYDAESKRLVSGRRFMVLSLIDNTGQLLWQGQVKVNDGLAQAQFNLPADLPTASYALHLGFQEEQADNFLVLKQFPIFNRNEVLNAEPLEKQIEDRSVDLANGVDISIRNEELFTKEALSFSVDLKGATEADVSIQVRKVGQPIQRIDQLRTHDTRAERAIDLTKFYDHHYLQFDLKRISPPLDSILPLIFVPEQHKTLGFLKSKGDQFTLDATDLTAGPKHFYFNQFIYRAYIPPDLEWDYEKARYKDNLMPYYEGEMRFEWVSPSTDFRSVLPFLSFETPHLSASVRQYAKQLQVRELLSASNAYGQNNEQLIAKDLLLMEPLLWRNAEDFVAMDNMAEFLFEIVTGIKAWYSDKRKDIRVLNADGPYDDIPLILVNGVPTRDVQKVLDLPIASIAGAGVIKDHKSQGQYKYNKEALPYGAFAAHGLILIKLKPDVVNPFQSDFNALLQKEVYLDVANYSNEPKLGEEEPDLRTDLVWIPHERLLKRSTDFSFKTSDIAGEYEIVVQGLKKGGGKLVARKTFKVLRPGQ